jgi:putative hemolysin
MNTIAKTSLRTLLGAAALAAVAMSVQPAAAQTKSGVVHQPTGAATDLAAAQGRARVTPVPCNGVASCNSIISYCAEKGGNWKETSHNGQGQPTGGTCYLP